MIRGLAIAGSGLSPGATSLSGLSRREVFVRDRGARPTPAVVSVESFGEQGATVVVDGDLDLDTAPQLEAAISDRISDGDRHLVIDLSAATFLDSMAMGTLLTSIAPLRDDATAIVVLVSGPEIVERSLAVSGVGEMFTAFDTREAAISGLSGTTESLRHTWRHVRLHPSG
jgi:anti-anti-sigma factor